MPGVSKFINRLVLTCTIGLAASACGDDAATSATAPDASEASPVASPHLSVLPESLELVVGRSLLLTTATRGANAAAGEGAVPTSSSAREGMSWTTTDPKVATVDDDGRVTAVSDGLTEVVARSDATVSRGWIRVVRVAAVEVTPSESTIGVSETVRLQARTRSSGGYTLTGRRVTWSSTAPSIATVDGSGRVVGRTAGHAVIVAESEGRRGNAQVIVSGGDEPSPDPEPGLPAAVSDLAVAGVTDTTITLRFTEVGDGASGAAHYEVRRSQGTMNWATATPVSAGTCTSPLSGTSVGQARTCIVSGLSASTAHAFQLRAFRGTPGSDAVYGAPSNVVTGTTSTPIAPPAQPPAAAGLVFASSWSTALGSTENAVKDGGTWPALTCMNTFPTVLTVIAGSSVGFSETPNVLRVQMRGPNACGMLQKNDAVPISTTHWGRFYVRNDDNGSKNDHPVAYHNIHGSDDIQGVPFARFANRLPAGRWQPGVVGHAPYPNNKWYGPSLQNGVWYRYEWQTEYGTATTTRVHPRIYDQAGTLVFDASDFVNDANSMNLQQWYDAGGTIQLANGGTPNAEFARNFGMGNEGPGSAPVTLGYTYYAKVGLSTSGWIGR